MTALVASAVVLGAAMLSTVLAAPAHLAVEPPPPPAGVEPRPQPPIGRGDTEEPGDPVEAREEPAPPQPVAHTRTGRERSTRSPDEATTPGNTASTAGAGTGSPAEPFTAQPEPGIQTPAAGPVDPPDAGDSDTVYYKNCAKARKAGALPLLRGEPGYSEHLDKDGDGKACNKRGGNK